MEGGGGDVDDHDDALIVHSGGHRIASLVCDVALAGDRRDSSTSAARDFWLVSLISVLKKKDAYTTRVSCVLTRVELEARGL